LKKKKILNKKNDKKIGNAIKRTKIQNKIINNKNKKLRH